jgi:ArsR family metal-binding transcriptional regulator
MADDYVDANVVADIYKNLPGKNCGDKSPCGLPKCGLFARALLKGKSEVYDCPYMEDEKSQAILLIVEDYFR